MPIAKVRRRELGFDEGVDAEVDEPVLFEAIPGGGGGEWLAICLVWRGCFAVGFLPFALLVALRNLLVVFFVWVAHIRSRARWYRCHPARKQVVHIAGI